MGIHMETENGTKQPIEKEREQQQDRDDESYRAND